MSFRPQRSSAGCTIKRDTVVGTIVPSAPSYGARLGSSIFRAAYPGIQPICTARQPLRRPQSQMLSRQPADAIQLPFNFKLCGQILDNLRSPYILSFACYFLYTCTTICTSNMARVPVDVELAKMIHTAQAPVIALLACPSTSCNILLINPYLAAVNSITTFHHQIVYPRIDPACYAQHVTSTASLRTHLLALRAETPNIQQPLATRTPFNHSAPTSRARARHTRRPAGLGLSSPPFPLP